jgi:putative ABC transport system permease protein
MIWMMSWKNVWRNRNRSLVVIIAVTLGIISGVLVVGIMEGWVAQRLHDAIYNEVSHLQIHNAEYLKNEDINLSLIDTTQNIKALDASPEVKAYTLRTKIFAMLNTPWANTGVMIYGIDPAREKQVTDIYTKIIPNAGEYLDKLKPGNIIISDKTAEILKIKQYIIDERIDKIQIEKKIPDVIISKLDTLRNVRFRSQKDFKEALRERLTKKELDKYGSLIVDNSLDYRIRNKIQVTISDETGTPVQGTFRLCGIYKTTNTGFDQTAVFVDAPDLASLYDKTILVHEIAVVLKNIEDADIIREKLAKLTGDNTISTWKELAPDAAMMNDYMIMYYFIFMGIILLALAFGIINTMMMAILERTKELGMLMAIGMNRRRVFKMIMLETIFLTSIGAFLGMISGWLIVSILGKSGIHFVSWGEGFEAIGYAATVYPVIKTEFFLTISIMVIITAIISSLWPARKALKLIPVEALRTE